MKHSFTKKINLLGQFILFNLMLFSSTNSFGSHGVGADLTYEHISGNSYRIILSFYRDCVGISAPMSPIINISSASCGQNTTLTLTQTSWTEVSMLCSSTLPNSTCNGGNIPGIEEYIYESIFTFPTNCSDWYLTYSVCCRNAQTSSVPNPQNYNLYVDTELDNLTAPGNNSPYFTHLPIFYACSGNTSIYTPGAVDDDGDSLVYSLVNPLDNPTTPIPYLPPYSATYPVTTSPPNNFSFDTNTGQMIFTPDVGQVTIVALMVEEFRNGVKIGSIRRDVQLIVLTGCSNTNPTIAAPLPGTINGGTISGNVISTCSGQTLSFQITATDADINDTLSVFSNIATFPGATLTTSGVNPVIIDFNWPATSIFPGNHPLLIKVSDTGCPIIYNQSLSLIISTKGVEASATPNIICGNTTTTVQLNSTISGLGSNGTFAWTPTVGLNDPTIQNPVATVSSPITYTVSYSTATCNSSDTVHIGYGGALTVTPSAATICQGSSVQLNASFQGANPNAIACGLYLPGCQGVTATYDVGTDVTSTGPGTTTNEAGSPFLGYYHDGKLQAIYKASELNALGITEGLITELAFNVSSVFSTIPYNQFTIGLDCVSDSIDTSSPFFLGAPTPVYSSTYTPTVGWNTFVFNDAYYWNGTDDLLVQVCFDNNTFSNYDHVFYSQTSFPSVAYRRADFDVGCAMSGPTVSDRRPNIRLTTCGNPSTNQPYTWTPATGLDDPTISDPIASPISTTTYTVTTNDGNCTFTETVTITVINGIQFTLNTVDPGCGMSNGSISVNTTSGAPPFTFDWSDPTIGNTPNATGLASGTYHLTITDANGCLSTATSVLSSSLSTAPTGLVITPASACMGDTVSLMATGGTAGPGATLVYYEGSCGGTVVADPTTVVVSGSGNYYVRYEDPCGVTACAMAGVSCFNYDVEVASLLGGNYNPTSALMSDDLRAGNLLPFTEPYSAMGYQHIGGGNESTVAAVFSVTGPNAIVDWVFVELRAAADNTTPVVTRSALMQADGDIVDMDGSSGVDFSGLGIAAGNYWIVVRHKSHLDVMSTAPVYVGGASTATYNFITTGAYNNGQLTLGNGTKVLYDGDVNQDNTINSADRSAIWNTRNQAGYIMEDVTLNGYCGADDRSKAWNNRNVVSQVP